MSYSVEELLAGLKAAGEETRLRVLALFESSELTVTELVTILRQSQPRVSRHLKLLCEAGLLERHREGTWIFYRLAEAGTPGGDLARAIMAFIPLQDQLLQHDQERLQEVKRERNEKAAEYFRLNAENWDKIRSLYVPERDVEKLLLELTAGMKIDTLLDVGTGTGRMLEIFAPHIGKGIGIDLSREMLSVARVNLEKAGVNNCQVRQGDMYDLALPDRSVDLVLFHQVLHFADEPLSALKETSRLLKKGGGVIIVDFSPHDLEFLREEHAHRRLGFADEEISAWCRQVGLICDPVIRLKGRELEVSIWMAHKK